MTAKEMFEMTPEEFCEAVRRNSQAITESSFGEDGETFEEQVEQFGSFKQSEESIRHLLGALN